MRDRKNIIFLFIVLFMCSSCTFMENVKDDVHINVDEIKLSLINTIVTYDESLNAEFLEYVYDEYGIDCLEDIVSLSDSNGYDMSIWHKVTGMSLNVLYDYYNDVYENADNVKVIDKKGDINLSFVGDISLADDWEIIPHYDSRGQGVYGILGDEVVDIMKSSDIMVANNEFTVSNRGSKLPNKYYTFRAKPERLAIYDEMGVDIVSIANNHAYDYGEDAFSDTLDSLKEYDIPYQILD